VIGRNPPSPEDRLLARKWGSGIRGGTSEKRPLDESALPASVPVAPLESLRALGGAPFVAMM
jgi:hypothetical protein